MAFTGAKGTNGLVESCFLKTDLIVFLQFDALHDVPHAPHGYDRGQPHSTSSELPPDSE